VITGTAASNVNTELREFLRVRRARRSPIEAGLPARSRDRRVPGLRREEVAQLSGISVDYYVRLERGRNPGVSDSVLAAVARTLGLSSLERDHLFALARPDRGASGFARWRPVRAGLTRLLGALQDLPALVLGPRLDVLASNPLAQAFYTDFDAEPLPARNMAHFVFLNEAARELYVDWPSAGRGIVGSLHLYAGRHPGDPHLADLVERLAHGDADFRQWWREHDVSRRTHGRKSYRHPLVGELSLDYEALSPAGDAEQVLGVHTAEPGSSSEQALRALAAHTRAERGLEIGSAQGS
jgi:transcriptional regulator with XRE-family HTH domain